MNLFTKQKHSQTQRTNLWLPGESVGLGGGVDWEFGIDMYTLLYLKQMPIRGKDSDKYRFLVTDYTAELNE